jgi:hypothetical protein
MSDTRSASSLLTDLAAALVTGSVRVVDLTMPLGPETPVLPRAGTIESVRRVGRDVVALVASQSRIPPEALR